jgi:transcriptional regulator with XRE-family HTH domain
MDRAQLADFLRSRREAIQPGDVGLTRGPRRRTNGLRREDVAQLTGMSTDYYARLEQQRGPQPSEQMVAAIARGLRLTLDERDHLFRLAAHTAPTRVRRSDHVSPALMKVLDRLDDTPAQVMSDLGETLVQNRLAVALLGDQTQFTGAARSVVYRWFTDPAERAIYPEADREHQGRFVVSNLRASLARSDPDGQGAAIVAKLRQVSPEFESVWNQHEVAAHTDTHKTIVHQDLGNIELDCQILFTENQAQALLVFTASPGSEGHEKLQLLSVIGTQRLSPELPEPLLLEPPKA